MRYACGERGAAGLRLIACVLVLVACPATSLSACSGADHGAGPGAGEWAGTVTVESGVTTVANASGSVWEGKAHLVEEASIGVEAGADEYMFGLLFAVRATDEHIYVTGEQTDMVRRCDLDGFFVGNVGATGQGPGEYGDPAMVAVTPAGRIIVYDFAAERMQVYAPDGKALESWPAPNTGCCTSPMLVDDAGTLWAPTQKRDPESGELTYGIQAFGPQGPIEPEYRVKRVDAPTAQLNVGPYSIDVPLMPRFTWTLAGPGRVLAGAADAYRFEVQERGETVMVVEKYWDPVPIGRDQADWQRKSTLANVRRLDPDWSWNGAGMPTHLPAYHSLIAATSGEMWVARSRRRQVSLRTHRECTSTATEWWRSWRTISARIRSSVTAYCYRRRVPIDPAGATLT